MSEAAAAATRGHLLRNIVLFGRLLRVGSLDVTPTQLRDWVAALELVDLAEGLRHYLGPPRAQGSHLFYETPWHREPLVNIQSVRGMAKHYQVRQVIKGNRQHGGGNAMNGHDRYAYRVIWSDEDGKYVGLCAEFGSLSHLDDTPEGAFAGIRDVVTFAVNALREDSGTIPSRCPRDDTDGRSRSLQSRRALRRRLLGRAAVPRGPQPNLRSALPPQDESSHEWTVITRLTVHRHRRCCPFNEPAGGLVRDQDVVERPAGHRVTHVTRDVRP